MRRRESDVCMATFWMNFVAFRVHCEAGIHRHNATSMKEIAQIFDEAACRAGLTLRGT